MSRRFRLAFLTAVAAAICLGRSSAAPRPNILFLLSDDQRIDTIAAYGNPHVKTPHLDRLAGDGFNFRRAHCMGSMHGAVCQPSRAMINSGRTLYRVPMDLEDVKILPEVLREAGYATFGTGKWHNGPKSFARGFALGKAAFMGGMSNHLQVPVADLAPDGTLVNKRTGEKFSSELFADATIGFLKGHRGDKPFYAYLAFTAPHDPRMPPPKFLAMYDPAEIPLPKSFMPQHPFFNGWMTGRDECLAPWPRPPEMIRSQLAEYYGMITHMDEQIGRVLGALEETGRAKNTVILFTSDQGLAVGSHGLLGKQNLYEHSMGSPLIVCGPGVPRGSSDALVYLFDLYPTVCELAGAELPDKVEGKSLVPIWEGRAESVRDSLFTSYENCQRAVRDQRWKLIRYPLINKTQLFDLKNDPDELNNLADDPAQADRVAKMTALLEQWQAKTDDRQPLTSENPQSAEIDLTGRPRKPDPHQPEWIVRKYFGDQ
ncbi:MAG TPA: sulfatase-like hydrolase/transferase [Thermoguttaceae bacterium]|nr:sulfatase-like hydrolase/transferase [Thermoguttaceae bacterium]